MEQLHDIYLLCPESSKGHDVLSLESTHQIGRLAQWQGA